MSTMIDADGCEVGEQKIPQLPSPPQALGKQVMLEESL